MFLLMIYHEVHFDEKITLDWDKVSIQLIIICSFCTNMYHWTIYHFNEMIPINIHKKKFITINNKIIPAMIPTNAKKLWFKLQVGCLFFFYPKVFSYFSKKKKLLIRCFFQSKSIVCLFYSGFTSLWTIFQSYRDGEWMWQGAQCSLLECCLTEISCPRHLTWFSIQSHYTDTELTSSDS